MGVVRRRSSPQSSLWGAACARTRSEQLFLCRGPGTSTSGTSTRDTVDVYNQPCGKRLNGSRSHQVCVRSALQHLCCTSFDAATHALVRHVPKSVQRRGTCTRQLQELEFSSLIQHYHQRLRASGGQVAVVRASPPLTIRDCICTGRMSQSLGYCQFRGLKTHTFKS
jgi:hypothetical protein